MKLVVTTRAFYHLRSVLCALLYAGLYCHAATSASSASEYRITHWTAEKGLPQNTIRALVQTPDAYIWAGTLAGLARFDGVKFTVFDHRNTPEMVHDTINALAVDRKDGSLWIATGSGLLRYRDRQFVRFRVANDGLVGQVWPARDGGVWLPGRDGELLLFREEIMQRFRIADESPWSTVRQVEEEASGQVLSLCGGRLYRCDPATGRITHLPLPSDRTEGGTTACFLRDQDDALWIAAPTGIWREKNGKREQVVTLSATNGLAPERLARTRDGQMWLAMRTDTSQQPVQWRVTHDQLHPFLPPDLPANALARLALEDREGNLWFASQLGLFQLRPKYLRMISTQDGLASDDITTLCNGADGAIWVGTSQGVSRIRENQVLNLPLPPLAQAYTRAYLKLVNSRNGIWSVWHGSGMKIFQHDRWEDSRGEEFSRGIGAAFEDSRGRFWVAANDTIFVEDHAEVKEYIERSDRTVLNPYVLYQDRRGEMWVGTKTGLGHLSNRKITWYTTNLGDYNNRAWWIHEDADGIFWLGSQNGLNRFVPPGVTDPFRADDAHRFFTFNKAHGLHDEVINNIQEDHFGNFWLSGLHGVFRISRRELNEVAAGARTSVHVLALGEADGMLNSECNGGDAQPAGAKDAQGRIWFPTAQGIVMIDPERILTNSVPPAVVIETVLADEKLVLGLGIPSAKARPGEHDFYLPAGRGHVLEIRYTANSFVAPERILFQYKLEGHDAKWRNASSSERVAYYTNLRPGAYRFQVKASNNHGIWNQEGASFSFALAPSFTQTAWFPVLCALGLLAASASFGYWRLRWQMRVLLAEQNASLERERSRIARDLHDDLGTALTGLALELDVLRRQHETAEDRLGATASRTRQLAERMREVVWAVNPRCDTVSSLASFLEQQAAQFLHADGIRGRFDFPEQIPPLPIESDARHQLALAMREALTNVVRHSKATEVTVSLALERASVVVKVKDNGNGGRTHATASTNSNGLGNMRDRLASVGGSFDLMSDPSGTTVVFTVPLPRIPIESQFRAPEPNRAEHPGV